MHQREKEGKELQTGKHDKLSQQNGKQLKKCPRLKEGKLIKSQKSGSSWVMQELGTFYAPLNHISFTPESHFYAPLDHSFSPLLDHIFIHPWITFLSIPG